MTFMETLAPTVQRIATALSVAPHRPRILLVGYVVAKIAAGLLSRVLVRTRLDARTAEAIGLTKPGAPKRCGRSRRGSPSGSSCSSC